MTDQLPENHKGGRWSAQEHDRFVKALSLYGKDWKKVERFVGTRSILQVRSHAQKYFLKLKKRYTVPVRQETSDSPCERITDKLKDLEREYFRKLNFLNYSYCLQLLSSSHNSKPFALPSIDLSRCESGNLGEFKEPLPKLTFPKVHEKETVKDMHTSERPSIT